jgi:hypothetical protein
MSTPRCKALFEFPHLDLDGPRAWSVEIGIVTAEARGRRGD